MSFERWMLEVDGQCRAHFGLAIHDLPDMCCRDAYDSGQTPAEFMEEYVPDLDALRTLVLS